MVRHLGKMQGALLWSRDANSTGVCVAQRCKASYRNAVVDSSMTPVVAMGRSCDMALLPAGIAFYWQRLATVAPAVSSETRVCAPREH